MTRNITVAFILVTLALPFAAYASQPRAVCKIYSKESTDLPTVIQEILSMRYSQTEAVRQCSFGSRTGYQALSSIRKGMLGVCSFDDHPVYPQLDTAAEKWSFKRPGVDFYIREGTVRMALARGDCPRHNDEIYTEASGVSEGTFVAVSQFLMGLSQNSRAAEMFYQPAIEDEKTLPHDQQLMKQAQRDDFVKAVHAGAAIKLWSLTTNNRAFDGVRYSLSFSISHEQWFGFADFTREGIRFFSVMKFN